MALAFALVAASLFGVAAPRPSLVARATSTAAEPCQPEANAIAAGPDGQMWFTEAGDNEVVSMTTAGVMTEHALPVLDERPTGIVAGPDGRMWFGEPGSSSIGAISTSGVVTDYPAGGLHATDITVGSDGALWFSASSGVGRITTAGVVTTFPGMGYSAAITSGSDGALWLSPGPGAGFIWRITTSGITSAYNTPSGTVVGNSIASGSDGNIWFPMYMNGAGWTYLGRATTTGIITLVKVAAPNSLGSLLHLTGGPDGNIWAGAGGANGLYYALKVTPLGLTTQYALPNRPFAAPYPSGMSAGPDGRVWIADFGSVVAVTTGGTSSLWVVPSPLPVTCGVIPGGGPLKGGTHVTIGGRGFTGATTVLIGSVPVAFRVVDDNTVTTTTPPSAQQGSVPVMVQRNGSGLNGPEHYFDYEPPPAVTGINPSCGSAGQYVLISGNAFAGVSKVSFGGTSAQIDYIHSGLTWLSVYVPRHAPGPVHVVVTAYGGTSVKTPADLFLYSPGGACPP